MSIIVQKYGGSSVSTTEKIINIAKRLIEEKKNGKKIVAVVSAMGDTTNNLISLANEISTTPSQRELDSLLSTGEQVTIALLAMAIEELGQKSISLTGFQAGFQTKGMHTQSKIENIDIKKVKDYLDEDYIVIIAGFQGINENGDITTLGRGGSDVSAVALAAKLKCPCEIYSDVDGVCGVDPRLYPPVKKLDYITYEEMMEMASLGSGIMEARSIEIGMRHKVPIYIGLSTGEKNGTYIKEYDSSMEERLVTGISAKDDILMITLNNVPYNPKDISKIFEDVADGDVNIDMITQSSPSDNLVDVSFTTIKDFEPTVDKIINDLKEDYSDLEYIKKSGLTKVSVVGNGMREQSGVAAQIFKIFSDNNIEFIQITTSEISISYIVNSSTKRKVVTALCKELGL